jgi:hypothetical protein
MHWALRLETNFVCTANQRGSCIEQTADCRSFRRIELLLPGCAQQPIGVEMFAPALVAFPVKSGSASPGFPTCTFATGESERSHACDALPVAWPAK